MRASPCTTFVLVAAVLGVIPSTAAQDGAPPPPDRVSTQYTVTLDADLRHLFIEGSSDLYRVAADPRMAPLCGPDCSADELRTFYQAADPETRRLLVAALQSTVAGRVEIALATMSGAPRQVAVSAKVDVASLEGPVDGPPQQPPIPVAIYGTAALPGMSGPRGLDTDQVRALFAMGARIKTPVAVVVEPGHDQRLTLAVPAPLALVDAGKGVMGSGNRSAGWALVNANGTKPLPLADVVLLGRPDVPLQDGDETRLDVVVDLSHVRPSPRGVFGSGPVAEIDATITVNVTLSSVAVPRDLPAQVLLPALSAEGLRVALGAGLVDESILQRQAMGAREHVERVAARAFGRPAPVVGGFVNDTLHSGAVDAGRPVQLVLRSNATMQVPGTRPPAPRGGGGEAPALTITRVALPTLEVPIVKMLGRAQPSLMLVLPPGTSFEHEEVRNGTGGMVTLPDGRHAFAAQGDGEGRLQITGGAIVVGPGFLWRLAGPFLLVVAAFAAVAAASATAIVRWRAPRH